MIKNKKIFSFVLFICFYFSLNALAVPQLKGRVNDYAGLLKASQRSEIESFLQKLEDTNGTQLVVLTIPSLENEELASYSLRVCEKWQLGQKDKDNGILLLVAYNEHLVRIETGYGVESSLTDAKCGLIIRNVIIPEFRAGNYYEGINLAVKNIAGIVTDNAELVNKSVANEQDDSLLVTLMEIIPILIWIIFVSLMMTKRGFRRKSIFFMPYYGNHTRSSGLGSRNSFNTLGGGSLFSGGGGHFGGGGASGHW